MKCRTTRQEQGKAISYFLLFFLSYGLQGLAPVQAQRDLWEPSAAASFIQMPRPEMGDVLVGALDLRTGEIKSHSLALPPEAQAVTGQFLGSDALDLGYVERRGDNRFYLSIPAGNKNSQALTSVLQRGVEVSVLGDGDFDADGYTDIAVVRRGHRNRLFFLITLRPFSELEARRRRLFLPARRAVPFLWPARGGRHVPAGLELYRKRNAKARICRARCRRVRVVRIRGL